MTPDGPGEYIRPWAATVKNWPGTAQRRFDLFIQQDPHHNPAEHYAE
jgi:hypothetical protein